MVDGKRFNAQLGSEGLRRYFAGLERGSVRLEKAAESRSESLPFLDILQGTPAGRRVVVLQSMIREQACKVLSLPAQHVIDPKAPLAGLGLDSLMAVELRNLLGRAIGQALPATLLFDFPSIAELTAKLGEVLGLESVAPVAAEKAPVADDDVLGRLEQLSDEQLDALLHAQLKA